MKDVRALIGQLAAIAQDKDAPAPKDAGPTLARPVSHSHRPTNVHKKRR
jgi:hypothetical protein